jgi:hypothetical protein
MMIGIVRETHTLLFVIEQRDVGANYNAFWMCLYLPQLAIQLPGHLKIKSCPAIRIE